MIEVACTCDGLPAHSHVFAPVVDVAARRTDYVDSGEIRVWVDWKAVARDLTVDQ